MKLSDNLSIKQAIISLQDTTILCKCRRKKDTKSFGQMSFGQMSFGQMSFGQMSFGQMS